MDIVHVDVIKKIGAISLGESVAQFDELVFELISSLGEETEEQCHGTISAELLDSELVKETRKAEMKTFRKHGVYEKVPIQER